VEELCFADDAAEGCADFGCGDNDVDAGSGPGFYLVDCALAAASGVICAVTAVSAAHHSIPRQCGGKPHARFTARRRQLAPPQVVIIEGMASLKELFEAAGRRRRSDDS